MLVGGSMEYIVGVVGHEYLLHSCSVGDARHYSLTLNVRIVLVHEEAYIVHWRFGLVNQNEPSRLVNGYLPYHLRTYGACCARDEYYLIFQQLTYGIHIDLNLVARQEVFYLHFAHLLMLELHVLVPRLCLGHHHYLDAGIGKLVNDILLFTEIIGHQRTDEYSLDTKFLHLFD